MTAVLKGVGKINGDGWKDTTFLGQVVYVWNTELPEPYKPGQYPRIGNPGWSASTDQYDFTPATAEEAKNAVETLVAELEKQQAEPTISIQEAWEAAGGNPGIKATKEELLDALRIMDEAVDEADAQQQAEPVASLIVGHSVERGGWCVYEDTGGGEYAALQGPFGTREEAAAALDDALGKP